MECEFVIKCDGRRVKTLRDSEHPVWRYGLSGAKKAFEKVISGYYPSGSQDFEVANGYFNSITSEAGDCGVYVNSFRIPNGVKNVEISYRAFSEDDIYHSSCQSFVLPFDFARDTSKQEGREDNDYKVEWKFKAQDMKIGKYYCFIGGACDDGWWVDAAIISFLRVYL